MVITRDHIRAMRYALKPLYPQVKSAHMAEAYAYACGFNTSIALMAAVDTGLFHKLSFSVTRFHVRLTELGYEFGEPGSPQGRD